MPAARPLAPLLAALFLCAGSASAKPVEADMAKVRALTHLGSEQYAAGQYAEALDNFEAAYLIKDLSILLFNIGQCERLLGRHRQAASAYKRLLGRLPEVPDPKGPNPGEVQRLLASEEAAMKEEETRKQEAIEAAKSASPSSPANLPALREVDFSPPRHGAPVDKAERRVRTLQITGVALFALGAAVAAGAGTAFASLASDEASAISSGRMFIPAWDKEGARYDTLTAVSIATGGALAAAGAVLVALSLRKPDDARRSSSVTLHLSLLASPTLSGLSIQGAF